jgi:hypothetical protein
MGAKVEQAMKRASSSSKGRCTGDDVAGMVDARYVDPLGVRSPAGVGAALALPDPRRRPARAHRAATSRRLAVGAAARGLSGTVRAQLHIATGRDPATGEPARTSSTKPKAKET